MPWKLILTLVLFGLFIAFAGFNSGNTSTISFGFAQVENVPIFISLSISFLLGAFFAIPYGLLSNRKKKVKNLNTEKPANKMRIGRKGKATGKQIEEDASAAPVSDEFTSSEKNLPE